jgi:DNA-binding NarL/FixJ family response regulator
MIQAMAIIEDDSHIRQLLVEQISLHLSDCSVVEYEDGISALEGLRADPVDIALCDINIPGIDGITCIQKLKELHPQMQMIVLTVYNDPETIFNALRVGATGYLLKSTSPEAVITALRDVHAGGSPISSQIARKVVESFTGKTENNIYREQLSRRELRNIGIIKSRFSL